MKLECQSCHKIKDESIMDEFDGIINVCIECNNPEKWKRVVDREIINCINHPERYECSDHETFVK